MPSVFTKIIQRELPAHILFEDEHTIAFLDINPVSEGHALVVPKFEAQNALESPIEDLDKAMRLVQRLAPVIMRAVKAEGCVISTNVGEAAGQSVPHTHFHIIPRARDDELKPWPHTGATSDQLSMTAEKIKAQL